MIKWHNVGAVPAVEEVLVGQHGPALENARNGGGSESIGTGKLVIDLASRRGAIEGIVGIAGIASKAGISKAPISIAAISAVVVVAIVVGIVVGPRRRRRSWRRWSGRRGWPPRTLRWRRISGRSWRPLRWIAILPWVLLILWWIIVMVLY